MCVCGFFSPKVNKQMSRRFSVSRAEGRRCWRAWRGGGGGPDVPAYHRDSPGDDPGTLRAVGLGAAVPAPSRRSLAQGVCAKAACPRRCLPCCLVWECLCERGEATWSSMTHVSRPFFSTRGGLPTPTPPRTTPEQTAPGGPQVCPELCGHPPGRDRVGGPPPRGQPAPTAAAAPSP